MECTSGPRLAAKLGHAPPDMKRHWFIDPWSFSGDTPASELARGLRSYLTKQLWPLFSETRSDSSNYSQYCQASETRHQLDEEKWWPMFEGQGLPDYWRSLLDCDMKELKINCGPRFRTTTMSPNRRTEGTTRMLITSYKPYILINLYYIISSCNYTWH